MVTSTSRSPGPRTGIAPAPFHPASRTRRGVHNWNSGPSEAFFRMGWGWLMMIETMVFHGWNHSFWWFNYGGWWLSHLYNLCLSMTGWDGSSIHRFFHDGMGFRIGGWEMQKTMVFCGRSSIVGFDLGLWNTNGWALISHPKTTQNILGPWCDGMVGWRFSSTEPIHAETGVGTCKHY